MAKISFDHQPMLRLLDNSQLEKIHEQALTILSEVGACFECDQALDLLAQAGCEVDRSKNIAKISPNLVMQAIESAPESFQLYNRAGDKQYQVGGSQIELVPSISATGIMLENGEKVRVADSEDLIKLTCLEEEIPEYRVLSPAVVCSDIDPVVGDAYRNYLMLKYSDKPFISEAWGIEGIRWTNDLMVALRGSQAAAADKPTILVGLCPITPLKWGLEAAQNLIDAVGYGIPINICVCPMLGSGSPVTIAGAVALQVAEFLSGLVLSQIVKPGARIVFGGYSTSMDMKTTVAAMTAVEATMAVVAHGQMAKYYNLPSQTFAACSESKTLDYQGGWETALTGLVAVQAGINLIYGPGSADYLLGFSYEKLLIDADICRQLYRFARGITFNEDTLALKEIKEVGPGGNFMMEMHTMTWMKEEQCYPSNLVDRWNHDNWELKGKPKITEKARVKVEEMLENCKGNIIAPEIAKNLDEVAMAIAKESGLDFPLR